MSVKVRIAPSPTGHMHVGTAQSALYNWLFARRHGGQFFVRIDDTDRERSKSEYEEGIVGGLQWLGFDWDNTETIRQSERTALYRRRLQELLDSGKAVWREYTAEEKAVMEKEGRVARDRVIVLKDDGDPEREVAFDDVIRGRVSVVAKHIGQLVIAKALDEPLYHFASVVDDIDMGITHVLRGEDHLSNTPKHLLIYAALEAPVPRFAHLPLLLGTDRSKLSKRSGTAVSVIDYQKDYLPEAMVNFLGSLSYTFEPDMLTRDDMVAQFDLARVHKAGAIFDVKKLNWFNSQYIRQLPLSRFKQIVGHADLSDAAVQLMTDRLDRLSDAEQFSYFWDEPQYDSELLRWKAMSLEDAARALSAVKELLHRDGQLSAEALEALVQERFPGNRGAVYWPLRVALSGRRDSAGPLDIAAAIGPARVGSRVDEALRKLS